MTDVDNSLNITGIAMVQTVWPKD